MKYYIDENGEGYARADGTLCGLVECVDYVPVPGVTYEECEAESEEEAAGKLGLERKN